MSPDYPKRERFSNLTGKIIPATEPLYATQLAEKCENGHDCFLIGNCLRCGAPVCCPECCAEDSRNA